MSQFYASIQGARGEATRTGSKSSGITGHIRGWNVGARVEIHHDEKSGKDVVRVYKTGGSQNSSGELVAEFTEDGYTEGASAKEVASTAAKLITEPRRVVTAMNYRD